MKGGKRNGAGRPLGSIKLKTQPVLSAVRLSLQERDKAKAIGGGNVSAGVRLALAAYEVSHEPRF